ncbi:MAG: hypothetical protein ACP5N3_01395 [Candidatus Nanoarchaeia archaeon]
MIKGYRSMGGDGQKPCLDSLVGHSRHYAHLAKQIRMASFAEICNEISESNNYDDLRSIVNGQFGLMLRDYIDFSAVKSGVLTGKIISNNYLWAPVNASPLIEHHSKVVEIPEYYNEALSDVLKEDAGREFITVLTGLKPAEAEKTLMLFSVGKNQDNKTVADIYIKTPVIEQRLGFPLYAVLIKRDAHGLNIIMDGTVQGARGAAFSYVDQD